MYAEKVNTSNERTTEMKWFRLNESGKRFKTTLVKGGGNSFCEALRNTGSKFDVGIDEVLFTVGDDVVSEDEKDDELRKSLDGSRAKAEKDGYGGAIVFSTDVNSVELSKWGFKNWLVQKWKTLTNRLQSMKRLDKLRKKNDIYAWTVGKGFHGVYTGKNGKTFDENSIVLDIIGQKFSKVVKVAKEICEEFDQECVMVKDYETNQIYFISAS